VATGGVLWVALRGERSKVKGEREKGRRAVWEWVDFEGVAEAEDGIRFGRNMASNGRLNQQADL